MNFITFNKNVKLRFDIANNCLYLRRASMLLTEKEKRLLYFLMVNQGKVVGHSEICDAVWPERSAVISPNNILQLVFRLRIKLKSLGIYNGISTITGKGYQLDIRILPITGNSSTRQKARRLVHELKNHITISHIIIIMIIIYYIRSL